MHSELHNPTVQIVCDICGKVLLTRNAFKMHMKAVHGPKQPKQRQQCQYCKNWYTNHSLLQTHILNMHVRADMHHRCETCGFVSSTRQALVKHIRYRHTLQKNFKCGICDKTFKLALLLKEHTAVHTGVDLYKCDFCKATFKSSSNRYVHFKRYHPEEYNARAKDHPRHKATLNA